MLGLTLQILISLLVFAGVFLPVYAVFGVPVEVDAPMHRRVAAAVGQDRRTVFDQPMLRPVMNLGLVIARRLNIPALRRGVGQDLSASGNPSGYSVDEHLAICVICSIGLFLLTAAVDLLIGAGEGLLMLGPTMAAVGFFAPLWSLRGAANQRAERIAKQLPYTLDLIALVMAAGAGFQDAVATLIRDDPHDDLNQELRIALTEIEFGTTRRAALENLASRIPLETLRGVVGAVNQAEALGTPLSDILKLQADMMRMHRSVRAEKLAASASLRILIPSMIILMAVVVVVFAPLIIQAIRGDLL